MRYKISILALLLTLGACSDSPHPMDCLTGLVAWANCPPGTKGYSEHQANAETIENSEIERCEGYGFIPGTDAFSQCRMNLDINRENASQANQAALRAAMMEQVLKNNNPPPPPTYQQRTSCTSTNTGTTTYTNCN
jgi:hypothetical protein